TSCPRATRCSARCEPMNPAAPVTTLRGMNPSFKSWTYDDRGVYALLWSDRGAGWSLTARAPRDTTYCTYRQRSAHWADGAFLRTAIEAEPPSSCGPEQPGQRWLGVVHCALLDVVTVGQQRGIGAEADALV